MSQVYSTEPATTGRVVLDTTHGPIDINLWCKECPTTTRTFLQLCLDGYYNHMIFHRILSDFLIQTGLTKDGRMMCGVASANEMDGYLRKSTAVPSSGSGGGTSGGGTNISSDPLGLDRKKLEVNPRIRFNHRGQVAMAFPLDATTTANDTTATNDDDEEEEIAMLRYQFFITLDEAPFLDAKHVAFGTVAGATMFNALRIGRTDIVDDDGSGMPAVNNAIIDDDPPRIRSVKVDYHPFEDLVITADAKIPWKNTAVMDGDDDANGERGKRKEGKLEKRRKRRKGKRDLNVLSFGDEERDYDDDAADATATASGKGENKRRGSAMLSSHDVLSNESEFLSSRVDADVDERSKEKERNDAKEGSERNGNGANDDERREASPKTTASSSDNGNVSNARESSNGTRNTHENNTTGRKSSDTRPGSPKRDGRSHRRPPKSTEKSNRSEGVVGAVEARRARYLKSGTASSANKRERLKREGDTMARLFAFKNKVIETRGSNDAGGDRDDHDGDDDHGGGTHGEAKRCRADDSLASRMAKRAKRTEDEEDLRDEREAALAAMPGYSGRVDEDERECERGGDWLGTKFKCKRHVDHDSRRSALDRIGDGVDDVGGDGRRMDDYVVLDEKRSGKGRKNGDGERHHREHGRRNGSGKHAGRSHKSSGRHRPRY